jgi:hypothetical protein
VLEFLGGPKQGQRFLALEAYRILKSEYGEEAFQEQIQEVQKKWMSLHGELASEISGKKYFLWLSEFSPGKNFSPEKGLIGAFPHFISQEMLNQILGFGYTLVDATSGPMQPQVLFGDVSRRIVNVFDARRFPKRPEKVRAVNNYYADQYMHDVATRQLLKTLL